MINVRALVAMCLCCVMSMACSESSITLDVHLVTGLVAGPEFRTVQTTILTGTRQSPRVVDVAEANVHFGLDFAQGLSVSTFDLAKGEYLVRVRLLRANGTILAENTAALSLVATTALPIHITRDCVGVSCPSAGGSVELLACLNGRCVDPRCNAEAPEYCPEIEFCRAADECGATASCATTKCEEGLCIESANVDACSATQWCNPDPGHGCESLMESEPPTIECDTVCIPTSSACEYGYWRCSPGEAPTCSTLQRRPAGYGCGSGRICDIEGDCIADPSATPEITVTPVTGLVVDETASVATFTVVLGAAPSADVSIGLTSSDLSEGTVTPGTLVFTSTDWDLPQTVTVTGVDDFLDDGDVSFTVTTTSAMSGDARYEGLAVDDVAVTCTDDDVASVAITPIVGLRTSELGASASFDVVLTSIPSDDVSFTLASSNVAEGTVDRSAITFTPSNWNVAQTVTVTGVDDGALDGTQAYTIVTSGAASGDATYDGLAIDDIAIANLGVQQRNYVKASNPGEQNLFGGAVAISADANTFAVAARGEESNATGVNGNEANDAAPASGAVYIFVRSGGTWVQQAYVKASNSAMDDWFGWSLSLSDDGDTLAVGAWEDSSAVGIDGDESDNSAPNSGAVYVFTRSAGSWSQQAYLKASNAQGGDLFGYSASLSADGDTLSVGAQNEASNATGANGDQLNDLASQAGAVYVFVRVGSVWTQEAYLKASNSSAGDAFGRSVALADDGNTLAVGAYAESSSATGVGGDQSDNSAMLAGAVYVFTRIGSTWTQQAYVKASNTDAFDRFGWNVSLAADGDTMAVSAPSEASNATGIDGDASNNTFSEAGAVYVFVRSAGVWTQQAYVKASNTDRNDYFSESVALSGDGQTLAVGANYEASNATGVDGDQSNNALLYSGAVYVFGRSGAAWSQRAYVKASNASASDSFGTAVALDAMGTYMTVGAMGETGASPGVDADEGDPGGYFAGACYTFRLR